MEDTFIGIEIGGTKLQIVAGDASAQIRHRIRKQIDKQSGAEGIRQQIADVLYTLLPELQAKAIGIGFGGPVNWQTGKIALSHQIGGWSDFDIKGWLHSLSGLPVQVDNDANVAALGEALYGAGQGYTIVFYVTLGSGVGGGLVVSKQIYHGAFPGEAEIGHIRLDQEGNTIESRCSGWAVDARIRKAIQQFPESVLKKLVGVNSSGEAKFLKTALQQNDPVAQQILQDTAADLAFGLSHVVHLFHPEVIILGGGLSLTGEYLKTAVSKLLPAFVMKAFLPGPTIKLAELQEDAVPAGALALANLAYLNHK